MNEIESHGRISLSFDRGTLVLTGLERKELPSIPGLSVWKWDIRVGAWRCDAIYYGRVHKALSDRFRSSFFDEVMKPASISWPKAELPKLRPEQSEALEAWIQTGRRGQVIMPTGTGKTEVALEAMAGIRMATLVVAPVRDLMYQWH